MDLGALQGSPDDVIRMVVVLLSSSTLPTGQTVKTLCINCLVVKAVTRSAARSVGHCHSDFLIGASQTGVIGGAASQSPECGDDVAIMTIIIIVINIIIIIFYFFNTLGCIVPKG